MSESADPHASPGPGQPDPSRVADRIAIGDLTVAYAHAVDDRDWSRWEGLFVPDARIDYTSVGGIAGGPAEVAAWMPGAMAAFTFCMHSMSTHEVHFTGPDTAQGRLHVFNRNGVSWQGVEEIMDVGAVYADTYQLTPGGWRFAERIEHTRYITGGAFADMVRAAAVAALTPIEDGSAT